MSLINVQPNTDTKEKPAGLANVSAIMIQRQDILQFPAYTNTSVDCATLTGPFVLRAGAFAYVFYYTEDTGIFTSVPVGEKDAMSYQTTTTLVNRFDDKAVRSWARSVINNQLIIIAKDNEGKWLVAGDEARSMRYATDANTTTGEDGTTASSKGTTAVFTGGTLLPAIYADGADPFDLLLQGTLQGPPTSIVTDGATINFDYVAAATDGYEIDIATDEGFSNIVIPQQAVAQPGTPPVGGEVSDAVTGLLSASLYYSRVRTVSGVYRSSWSNVRSFTTT